jgi:glycosyltransferase involved in cell wall biosynthesis
MRGAALELLQRIRTPGVYDLICTGSLIDLTDLKALWPGTCPPAVLYFHENQLLYPLAPGEERDFHYGFTNVTSALAADRVVFNSWYHHDAFFAELPSFIGHLPDCRPSWAADLIRSKSLVLHPGIELCRPVTGGTDPRGPELHKPDHHEHGSSRPHTRDNDSSGPGSRRPADENPAPAQNADPVILWNHRWEHDKNPELFFRTLFRLKEEGARFKLIAAGEKFSWDTLIEAYDRLAEETAAEAGSETAADTGGVR